MSDDSPWKPPADGRAEPSLGTPTLPTLPAPPPPSPWAPGGSADTAPAAPPPPPMPSHVPAAPDDVPAAVPPATPTVTVGATPPDRSRRSRWVVGGAVASVLALGAAGLFAFGSFRSASEGGADAPSDLGVQLLAAIEGEDVLGVIDTLLPGERRSLGEPFVETVGELRRIGVLADDVDLARVLGIDVELSDESVIAESTNVPDIVNVSMAADAVVTLDGERLPIGDLISDNLSAEQLTELRGTRLTQSDRLELELTAVERDGRWYFSLLHTVAELARREAGADLIPVQGLGADGAATPEAAVDQLLDRIEALDLTGVLRTLDPGEAAALQRYAPLFIDDAEAALADIPLTWEITRRDLRIEGSGDRRTVFVDAIAIDGELDGSSFSVEFADGCLRASAAGEEPVELCSDAADAIGLGDAFEGAPEIESLTDVLAAAFDDVEASGLELREVEGEWYVSPLATVTEALLNALRALDRDEAQAIIDAVPPAIDAFTDSFGDALNELAGGGFVDPTIGDDVLIDDTLIDDVLIDDVPVDEQPVITPTDDAGWMECYDLEGAAEAIGCFSAAVDRGELDRAGIPVDLRYPECGLAELSWTGELYQLPDAEFIATIEAARPCYLALVDAGEISEWELSNEILSLECFEGRNWYQVFDDPEYDARFEACTSARWSD